MTNREILWHIIGLSLSYIYSNFDNEIETIVKCLKQLVSYKKTIATFETTQFLNTTDDELICGQWN